MLSFKTSSPACKSMMSMVRLPMQMFSKQANKTTGTLHGLKVNEQFTDKEKEFLRQKNETDRQLHRKYQEQVLSQKEPRDNKNGTYFHRFLPSQHNQKDFQTYQRKYGKNGNRINSNSNSKHTKEESKQKNPEIQSENDNDKILILASPQLSPDIQKLSMDSSINEELLKELSTGDSSLFQSKDQTSNLRLKKAITTAEMDSYITETIQKISSQEYEETKLNVGFHCYLKIKTFSLSELSEKHRIELLNVLEYPMHQVNEAPWRYGSRTIFQAMSLARKDFLDSLLDPKLIEAVHQTCQQNWMNFSLYEIILVFSGWCMRHKTTHEMKAFDEKVLKEWIRKIVDQADASEIHQKKLVQFLGYFMNDIELFKSCSQYIEQLLLQPSIYRQNLPLLLRSRNVQFLKVLITIFAKSKRGSPSLYRIFLATFYDLIASKSISVNDFNVILKYVCTSYGFISSSALPKPSTWSDVPENLGNVHLSEGGQHNQKNLQFVLESTKGLSSFKIIDEFITNNLKEMQNVQIITCLNLYNTLGVQSAQPTVMLLINELKKHSKFLELNYSAVCTIIKSACLFGNPELKEFLKQINSNVPLHLTLDVAGKEYNIGFNLCVLKYILNVEELRTKQLEELYQKQIAHVNNSLNSQQSPQLSNFNHKKEHDLQVINSILLESGAAKFTKSHRIEVLEVDFFIQSWEFKSKQMIPVPFVIEILPQYESIQENQRSGDQQLKVKVLRKMNLSYVYLDHFFCNQLSMLKAEHKENKLIQEIYAQLGKRKSNKI